MKDKKERGRRKRRKVTNGDLLALPPCVCESGADEDTPMRTRVKRCWKHLLPGPSSPQESRPVSLYHVQW